jgi:hypothetical protein
MHQKNGDVSQPRDLGCSPEVNKRKRSLMALSLKKEGKKTYSSSAIGRVVIYYQAFSDLPPSDLSIDTKQHAKKNMGRVDVCAARHMGGSI